MHWQFQLWKQGQAFAKYTEALNICNFIIAEETVKSSEPENIFSII